MPNTCSFPRSIGACASASDIIAQAADRRRYARRRVYMGKLIHMALRGATYRPTLECSMLTAAYKCPAARRGLCVCSLVTRTSAGSSPPLNAPTSEHPHNLAAATLLAHALRPANAVRRRPSLRPRRVHILCFRPKRRPQNRPTPFAQNSTSSGSVPVVTGGWVHVQACLITCTASVGPRLRAPEAKHRRGVPQMPVGDENRHFPTRTCAQRPRTTEAGW